MSWSHLKLGVFTAFALLATGCGGPFLLPRISIDRAAWARGVESAAAATGSDARVPTSTPAAEAGSVPATRESATAENSRSNEAQVQAALEFLKTTHPERYLAAKSLLDNSDPQLPPALRQQLRDQCIALLLQQASDRKEPLTAASANSKSPDQAAAKAKTSTEAANTSPGAGEQAPSPSSMPPPVVPASASSSGDREGGSESRPPGDSSDPPTSAKPSDKAAEARAEKSEGSTLDPPPVPWQQHLTTAVETLEKELARGDLDDTEEARLKAYLRLLCVVANRRDQAVSPIEGIGGDEREYWKHQLYGLLVSLDAERMQATNRRAALALRELRQATDYLANISTLDVRGLTFCSRVESFGRYTEFKPAVFNPGDEVLLYVEVDNFAVEVKGEQYETELQGEYEIVDAHGTRVANVVLPRDKQLCNNRRHDYFIAYRVYLPKQIPTGSYTLQLTVEDVKGKKSNQASIDFRIR